MMHMGFRGEAGIEYRPIPSKPNYFAGSDGSIWSFRNGKARKRKLSNGPKGYLVVSIGGASVFYVHHLILEAFVGPRPAGLEACFGPGGRADTRPSNLRYDTNVSTRLSGESNPSAKYSNAQIQDVVRLHKDGLRQRKIATIVGMPASSVNNVLTGCSRRDVTGFSPLARRRKKHQRQAAIK